MKLVLAFIATVGMVIYLPSFQARSLSKRAAFYIANETACVVDSIVYYNGDPIPTDDPCEACKCRPPGFACVLRECEVKPGCRAVRKAGHCCPDYVCGCEHNGRMFRDGDEIRDSQNPCYTCHCQGSAIACAFVDCFFRVDCAPEYVPGECCPRYDHCSQLGPSVNESISQEFTSNKPPPITTSRKTTVNVEVFTEDPFFGFADFGADGSVEGLRRRNPITTTRSEVKYDNERRTSDVPSDSSTISNPTSTITSTIESSTTQSENEDSTSPIFYLPEKESVSGNNEKTSEPLTTVTIEKLTESNTRDIEKVTEMSTKISDDIKRETTTDIQKEDYTTTEQSSKLLLYAGNDEHNHPKELVPPIESEFSEIHDPQDHRKENINEEVKENQPTTLISTTSKVIFGERIKTTTTATPIPVLLLNPKIPNTDGKDNNESTIVLSEINKDFETTTEENFSTTKESLSFVHNEDDSKIADVKSTTLEKQDDNQFLNQTETTTQNFDTTINNNKREGKKKNDITKQNESSELSLSTKSEETKTNDELITDTTITLPQTTLQSTAETTKKSSEQKFELHAEVKLESTTTSDITEIYTNTNPTTIVEEVKLSKQEKTTTQESLNYETSSTTVSTLSESETVATKSITSSAEELSFEKFIEHSSDIKLIPNI